MGPLKLAPMVLNDPENTLSQDRPHTDQEDWRRLAENIRALALAKSEAMLSLGGVVDEDGFDRDARNLRALMGSAEIAARMQRQKKRDDAADDEKAGPRELSEDDLDAIYDAVADKVERLAADDADAKARAREGDAARDPRGPQPVEGVAG
ncbi:MAG: hypothetical protein AAFX03_11590 [Pseudomonadota bacterium]